jgi:hypothetical protein
MKKIKLFLEFVSAGKESVFLPLTYEEIAAKLGCGVDEVEEFEEYLGQSINPGKSFHGSFSDSGSDKVDIFDSIEDEGDYMLMWKKYKSKVHSEHHYDDGL